MTHAHHWIIDSPDGPTSQGVCRVCEATRTFTNWHDEEGRRQRWANGLKTVTEKRWTTKGGWVR